ncbi:MAG: hypothetical protein K2W96_17570 [Gemmataceae bacterium]|nr:hypothetical protein [Gemmataceae bacterium]
MNLGSVWDVPGRKRLFDVKKHVPEDMCFSPDGKFLAVVGNYAAFHVYDDKGKEYWNLTLGGHGDTIVSHVEFTPDSRLMVASSKNGMLRVWDVKKKKPVALFCFPSPLEHDQAVQDGYLRAARALAGKGKNPDGVEAFVVFKTAIEYFGNFTLSPDGKTVAVPLQNSDVLLIELASGKILKTLTTKQKHAFSVRYSADGKMLAIGGGGEFDDDGWLGTIELWDVAKGKRVRSWKAHRHTVLHMAFSPDGKILASGGTVDCVRVWDAATGKPMYRLHEKIEGTSDARCLGVAFLPDGKALLTLPVVRLGDNSPVHFWEPATGKRLPQPLAR